MFHPLPTWSITGHQQSELGLVLLMCHIVEGAAQVLLGLCQSVGPHLQSRTLCDDLGGVATHRDPDVAVGWVGVGLALKEDQLSGVNGEHLSCPQALVRGDLQVVRAICRDQQKHASDAADSGLIIQCIQSGYISMIWLILIHCKAAGLMSTGPQDLDSQSSITNSNPSDLKQVA